MSRLACLLVLTVVGGAASVVAQTSPVALVYDGPFASGAQDFHGALRAQGFDVQYFSDLDALPAKLAQASAVVFPGTNDDVGPLEALVDEFSPDTVRALKAFVAGGGSYLGVCGGAYLASTSYKTPSEAGAGLALVPVTAESFLTTDAATIVPVTWNKARRFVYFQLGPKFVASTPTSVVATYADGSVAACQLAVGQGRVVLVGPHPEVLASQLEASDVADGTLANLTDTSDLLTDLVSRLKR